MLPRAGRGARRRRRVKKNESLSYPREVRPIAFSPSRIRFPCCRAAPHGFSLSLSRRRRDRAARIAVGSRGWTDGLTADPLATSDRRAGVNRAAVFLERSAPGTRADDTADTRAYNTGGF